MCVRYPVAWSSGLRTHWTALSCRSPREDSLCMRPGIHAITRTQRSHGYIILRRPVALHYRINNITSLHNQQTGPLPRFLACPAIGNDRSARDLYLPFSATDGYADQLARTEVTLNGIIQCTHHSRKLRAIQGKDGVPSVWLDETWKQLTGIWSGVKICGPDANITTSPPLSLKE